MARPNSQEKLVFWTKKDKDAPEISPEAVLRGTLNDVKTHVVRHTVRVASGQHHRGEEGRVTRFTYDAQSNTVLCRVAFASEEHQTSHWLPANVLKPLGRLPKQAQATLAPLFA